VGGEETMWRDREGDANKYVDGGAKNT